MREGPRAKLRHQRVLGRDAAGSSRRRARNGATVKAVSHRRGSPLYAAFQGGPKYASGEVTRPTRTISRRRTGASIASPRKSKSRLPVGRRSSNEVTSTRASPPDLRRTSACPCGADVGAGALASTASSITGHVDFVSRSRSLSLLTACWSSLGRSYAANAY